MLNINSKNTFEWTNKNGYHIKIVRNGNTLMFTVKSDDKPITDPIVRKTIEYTETIRELMENNASTLDPEMYELLMKFLL